MYLEILIHLTPESFLQQFCSTLCSHCRYLEEGGSAHSSARKVGKELLVTIYL